MKRQSSGEAQTIQDMQIRFAEVMSQYRQLNQQGLPNIVRLFGEYCSSSLEKRDKDEIVDNLDFILGVFEQNLADLARDRPASQSGKQQSKAITFLDCLEEHMERYTDACSNRTVLGVAAMSAFLSVAKQENVPEKLESARQLMAINAIEDLAQDFVTYFRKHLEEKNETGFPQFLDAELINLLLKKVHKELLENGKINVPWEAIPRLIVDEDGVESWLGSEFLDQRKSEFCLSCFGEPQSFDGSLLGAARQRVLNILQMPVEKVSQYLCESEYSSSWAMIIDPEKVQSVEEKYSRQKENFDELFGKMNLEDESLKSELTYGQVREFVGEIGENFPDVFKDIKDRIPKSWLPESGEFTSGDIVDKKEQKKGSKSEKQGEDFLLLIDFALKNNKHGELSIIAKQKTSEFFSSDKNPPSSSCVKRLSGALSSAKNTFVNAVCGNGDNQDNGKIVVSGGRE